MIRIFMTWMGRQVKVPIAVCWAEFPSQECATVAADGAWANSCTGGISGSSMFCRMKLWKDNSLRCQRRNWTCPRDSWRSCRMILESGGKGIEWRWNIVEPCCKDS